MVILSLLKSGFFRLLNLRTIMTSRNGWFLIDEFRKTSEGNKIIATSTQNEMSHENRVVISPSKRCLCIRVKFEHFIFDLKMFNADFEAKS